MQSWRWVCGEGFALTRRTLRLTSRSVRAGIPRTGCQSPSTCPKHLRTCSPCTPRIASPPAACLYSVRGPEWAPPAGRGGTGSSALGSGDSTCRPERSAHGIRTSAPHTDSPRSGGRPCWNPVAATRSPPGRNRVRRDRRRRLPRRPRVWTTHWTCTMHQPAARRRPETLVNVPAAARLPGAAKTAPRVLGAAAWLGLDPTSTGPAAGRCEDQRAAPHTLF